MLGLGADAQYWLVHGMVLWMMVWARFDSTAVSIGIIVLIFSNLGQSRGEYSAYSIFNKGCQYLLGDARQDAVEQQIRGGHYAAGPTPVEQKNDVYSNFPSKFINRPCPCGSGVKAKRCCAAGKPKKGNAPNGTPQPPEYDFTGFEVIR